MDCRTLSPQAAVQLSAAAAKEKILAEIQEQKVMALEISAKECTLQMKKLEFALSKETDAAKKAELEEKLQALKAKTEECLKKAEAVRKGDGPEKAAGEKKVEKK